MSDRLSRRDFFKMAGVGGASIVLSREPGATAPIEADKGLTPLEQSFRLGASKAVIDLLTLTEMGRNLDPRFYDNNDLLLSLPVRVGVVNLELILPSGNLEDFPQSQGSATINLLFAASRKFPENRIDVEVKRPMKVFDSGASAIPQNKAEITIMGEELFKGDDYKSPARRSNVKIMLGSEDDLLLNGGIGVIVDRYNCLHLVVAIDPLSQQFNLRPDKGENVFSIPIGRSPKDGKSGRNESVFGEGMQGTINVELLKVRPEMHGGGHGSYFPDNRRYRLNTETTYPNSEKEQINVG